MAETPKRVLHSPKKSKRSNSKPPPSLTPATPLNPTPRRSARRASLQAGSATPKKLFEDSPMKDATTQHELRNDSGKTRTKGGNVGIAKTPKSAEKGKKLNAKEEEDLTEIKNAISPVTPGQSETKKRKREQKSTVVMRSRASKNITFEENKSVRSVPKRRAYYKKVVYDGGEFEVGDNVFVRRREDASSDEVLVEVEEGCDD